MPVEPKLAATVILLRERKQKLEGSDNCEFEVFMAKRNGNSRFLGDHHVFPGGGIDNQDISEESRERIDVLDENFLKKIIAIRELFEETGILIAAEKFGNLVTITQENIDKFRRYQENLQEKRTFMTDILIKETLFYAANNLKYFGRLITPELSPIRFDTHFFLCKLPLNQGINLYNAELLEGRWGSPKHLLELYKKRQIKIIFPQYSALRRLRKFRTIEEAFDNSKSMFKIIRL